MTKYESLIEKIQELKTSQIYSSSSFLKTTGWSFSQSELEIITDALETVQFLEIILKARTENLEKKPTNHD